MPLTIANLTDNIATSAAPNYNVTGDGIFDDLMEATNAHLDAQFRLNRITGTDYATTYLGVMQAVIQSAVAYTLGQAKANAETDLLFQKEVTEFAQTGQTTKVAPDTASVLGRQNNLSTEQAKGFKWNADQKHLKTLLDAWAINISTAGVPSTGITDIQDAGMNAAIDAREPTG